MDATQVTEFKRMIQETARAKKLVIASNQNTDSGNSAPHCNTPTTFEEAPMKYATITSLFTVILVSNLSAQVPAEWDTARIQLTQKLIAVNAAIKERSDNQHYCTAFAGNLMLANSNRGYALFTPDTAYPYPIPAYQDALYRSIDTMLIAFDTLGYTAVDITIQYPLLVHSFPNSEHYLAFFTNVCNKVRQKGFKIIIGCQATFVDTVFGEAKLTSDVVRHYFDPDGNPSSHDTLDMNRYRQEKLQMLQTIIDSLRPDFLTLEMEPQTQEHNLFGLIDYSINNSISLINYFLQNLTSTVTLFGAGAGTWDSYDYFSSIATQTNVDYIDYHIYPPHFNYINDIAFKIDSVADANNKKLVIGESWCYKATNSEMADITQPVGTSQLVYSRDVFDYWVSVDTLFVKALVTLSQQSKVELVQFHWPNVMFGQLTYDSAMYHYLTPQQILQRGAQEGYARMFKLKLSPIGLYTKAAIANLCSVTAVEEQYLSDQINVYPNPTNSVLNIESEQPINSLSMFDLNGNQVLHYSDTQDAVTLPGHLAKGHYYLIIRTATQQIPKKILLKE